MTQKIGKNKQYTVFISHSSKDSWIAKQIAFVIEQKGKKFCIKTVLDEKDFETGDIIDETIRKSIQNCSEFLVLLSSASIQSDWVKIEIGMALACEKRIAPILEKINPDEMPKCINHKIAIDLNNFDNYLKQILNRVKEYANDDKAKRKN
jgi:hypothetical protein